MTPLVDSSAVEQKTWYAGIDQMTQRMVQYLINDLE